MICFKLQYSSPRSGKLLWVNYHFVREGEVISVHTEPALLYGFNITRMSKSNPEDWQDMNADQIAAYIRRFWDGAADCDATEAQNVWQAYERKQEREAVSHG